MPTTQRPARMRAGHLALCLGWGLSLSGCNHPLAQRPAWSWDARRVLVDDDRAASARPRPLSRGGFYRLVREWDQRGRVAPGAAPPGEIAQAYLEAGLLLGFRRSPDGRFFAVEDRREIEIQADAGVHHVWYRENDDGRRTTDTLLIGLLTAGVVVGLVALAGSDNSSIDIRF